MNAARTVSAAALVLALAGPAAAKESGNFIVTLGTDTTSVESYVRTSDRIEVHQVGRAPRVLRRDFVYDLKDGVVTHFALTVTPPNATTPMQTMDGKVDPDSFRLEIQAGPQSQSQRVALPPGTLLVANSSPWALYETQTMKLAASKADTVGTAMYLVGAGGWERLVVGRQGRDSMSIADGHGGRWHAKVDKTGHILGVLPISGTQKFAATRVDKLDLAAWTAASAAREQAAGAVGQLSPRDTVRANVGGAALLIDYGRPSKRGRAIYGGIVPYGEVWRTGANAATQFRTDKDLVINGTNVPAGFYTLWTLPTAQGWKLIVNGETGQWGTAHNAAKDLYTIDMKTSTLPAPVERFTIGIEPSGDGGTLNLDWDTTRASVAFTVKP